LKRALGETVITGVETTKKLHEDILEDPDFKKGKYDIHWLETWLDKKNKA
jgi:acetyl-CoA carboxylase biotin carboxylase subunit